MMSLLSMQKFSEYRSRVLIPKSKGAQWLSCQDQGADGSSLTGVTALWSLSKTL